MAVSHLLHQHHDLKVAARQIRRGRVVAYPCEACYGLGCDINNRRAVMRIIRLKRRPAKMGMIVIAAKWNLLAPLTSGLESLMIERMQQSWPGPHTWICNKSARRHLTDGPYQSIAMRISAHHEAHILCRLATIPIVSTSANRHQGHPAKKWSEVKRAFSGRVDFVVRGRIGNAVRPSEIRDLKSNKLIR